MLRVCERPRKDHAFEGIFSDEDSKISQPLVDWNLPPIYDEYTEEGFLIVKGHQYTGSMTIVMTIGECPKKKAELNLMEEESDEPIYHEESGGLFEEEVSIPNFNAECLLIQLVMVTKEYIGDVWDGKGCGKNDVMTTECFKPPICDENLEDNVKLEKLKLQKSLLITKEFVSAKKRKKRKKRWGSVEDTKHLTIEAFYGEDMCKFLFPLTSGIDDLKKEVSKRLNVEVDRFEIKYKDEYGHLISLPCDEDSMLCLFEIRGNDEISVFVFDKVQASNPPVNMPQSQPVLPSSFLTSTSGVGQSQSVSQNMPQPSQFGNTFIPQGQFLPQQYFPPQYRSFPRGRGPRPPDSPLAFCQDTGRSRASLSEAGL
ncbi:hypothetical protein RHSIM_Rhsim05G0025400 [Rhododendron simsii]|uniref:PB1 domain-containing protein n=1 Tax=Rhododendron simsii TaxID=118357 RepID=A0A834GY63_RHOSS|nr:hypothetical protein RHSIM_Rhsim05G0025400 [Rhododendron simsii]